MELHYHHMKLVEKLDSKIAEAQKIAQHLMDLQAKEASSFGSSKPSHGYLKDMKFKIYDVCKMIYEEQRLAGARMQQIERKVQQLKAKFTHQMSKQKGYLMSYDDIESLFDYQSNQSTLLHSEVQSKIKEIKSRHITTQLEE